MHFLIIILRSLLLEMAAKTVQQVQLYLTCHMVMLKMDSITEEKKEEIEKKIGCNHSGLLCVGCVFRHCQEFRKMAPKADLVYELDSISDRVYEGDVILIAEEIKRVTVKNGRAYTFASHYEGVRLAPESEHHVIMTQTRGTMSLGISVGAKSQATITVSGHEGYSYSLDDNKSTIKVFKSLPKEETAVDSTIKVYDIVELTNEIVSRARASSHPTARITYGGLVKE